MKITHYLQQIFNAIKNPNGIKLMMWYGITSITFFINKLMRILNY